MLDSFIFIVLPYVALVLLIVVTPYRFYTNRLTWTAYSSELLERKALYWGSMPWHYGIILVLLGHFVTLFLPGPVLAFMGNQTALLTVETIGLGLGVLALFGIVVLLLRRSNVILRTTTSPADWTILYLLAAQTALGVHIATSLRWGTMWSGHTAVPYIYSIFLLNPQLSHVAEMPLAFKLHVAGAFLIVAVLPFTRLVHLLFFPLAFLRDPPILYRWWRKPDVGR